MVSRVFFDLDGRGPAYVSNEEGGSQLWLRWMDGSGAVAKLTSLTESPGGLGWYRQLFVLPAEGTRRGR